MSDNPIKAYREKHDRMSLEAFGGLFEPPVDKSTVLRWERGRVPAERVLDVEERTGIPRRQLRPDLYPAEGAAA